MPATERMRHLTCFEACDCLLLPHLPDLCLGIRSADRQQQAVRVEGRADIGGGPRHLRMRIAEQ